MSVEKIMRIPVLCLIAVFLAVGCESSPRVYTIVPTKKSGDYTISGQIHFPKGTPAGHAISLRFFRLSDPFYASAEGAGKTDGGEVLAYQAVGLSGGEYTIGAAVDMNGNLDGPDPGDLDGFFGGTTESPIQDIDAAATITVSGASVDHADFGIGPHP